MKKVNLSWATYQSGLENRSKKLGFRISKHWNPKNQKSENFFHKQPRFFQPRLNTTRKPKPYAVQQLHNILRHFFTLGFMFHRRWRCLRSGLIGFKCSFWHCWPPTSTECYARTFWDSRISLQLVCIHISGRSQAVTVNSLCSLPSDLSCGVPQGSVLGLVDFIIYTEDLVSVIDKVPSILLHFFADDTQLSGSSKPGNVTAVCRVLEFCASK